MTSNEVQWILVIRYGKADHSQIYGRLGQGTYTGDYIQLTKKILDDLDKVFPDWSENTELLPITYKWPGGEQQGKLVGNSGDRPHLSWDYDDAPPPWKMGLNPSATTVETIPGNPHHKSANLADREYAKLSSEGFGQPFLIAIKLRNEKDALHLRVLVENPKPGFEWADLAASPTEVQELAAQTTGRSYKAWRLLDASDTATSLFFDPEKKANPWSTVASTSSASKISVKSSSEHSPSYDSDSLAEALETSKEDIEEFENSIDAGDYEVPDKIGKSNTRGSAQQAFSKRVKDNYGWKCALTGIQSKEFLIASHIVPWSVDKNIRLDPSNGICLSVLVDRAFENGFLHIHDDLQVRVDFEKIGADKVLSEHLSQYDGSYLEKPNSHEPKAEYLRRRRGL